MPLITNVLASGLARMEATDQESLGVDALTRAWLDFFQGASLLGVPASRPILDTAPKAAFMAALRGISQANVAPVQLQAAVAAFWLACSPLASAIWVLPGPAVIVPGTLIPPPGIASLAALLTSEFLSNTSGRLTLESAAQAVARVISLANVGGTIQTVIAPSAPVVQTIL
jgi:hypothetical protein